MFAFRWAAATKLQLNIAVQKWREHVSRASKFSVFPARNPDFV